MTMDSLSEGHLVKVHPDLVKVIRAALQTPQPFCVVYGLRTVEAQRKAVATGHSQTMKSRHLPNAKGFACAVDVAALIDGKVSWAPGHEQAVFGEIAQQIEAAAAALRIELQWGGAPVGAWVPGQVSHFRDWGHFQLRWDQYP